MHYPDVATLGCNSAFEAVMLRSRCIVLAPPNDKGRGPEVSLFASANQLRQFNGFIGKAIHRLYLEIFL
jgi:hypothetical protein